jgi:hypothetical protein
VRRHLASLDRGENLNPLVRFETSICPTALGHDGVVDGDSDATIGES